MPELGTDVRYIKGIGDKRAQLLNKLGVYTLRDLVGYFPRRYEDRTVFRTIAELVPGESVCVVATVATQPSLSRVRRGMDIVKFRVFDGTGSANVTFFNQSYVRDRLKPGENYSFYCKVGDQRQLLNPVFETEADIGRVTGCIVPVYRATAGLSSSQIAKAVDRGLTACGEILPDPLPASVRREYELAFASYAYENIHHPKDFEALGRARTRLIFEELFVLSCALSFIKSRRENNSGITLSAIDMDEFYSALPFELTGAQRRVIGQAMDDMRGVRAMNRLVQGDVGSGKTAVAAACAFFAERNGMQCAYMAPTEILARQHFETLSGLLEPLGVHVGLLTGSMTAAQKREIYALAETGLLDLVVGTHALISEGVKFKSLALVVTDEQHRFGVNQRMLLAQKGESPHVMVMSATPIPRTLALIMYGDLDVSIIDELPPGRKKIRTFAVREDMRPRIEGFIRRLVSEGRQVYIVCPMVEENETMSEDIKSVTAYAERLQTEVFPELRVALVHGKLKASKKDQVMEAFSKGEADILVATTVIEVGVDVPNAALMVIENAERFGLSQLHQLRGRVGRGTHESYCVMFSDAQNEDTRARLEIMVKTNDGFAISEEDLRIRGPGDFFGSRQHGLPEFRIADLSYDVRILSGAQEAAAKLLADDPKLECEENHALLERIRELFELNADILN